MKNIKAGAFLSQISRAAEQENLKNLESAFAILSEHNLKCIDVDGANIGKKYDIVQLKNSLEESRLKVSSIYFAVNFDWRSDTSLNTVIAETEKQLEYCAYLNTDLFMPVLNIMEEHKNENERTECQKRVIEYLNKTSTLSQNYSITTALENYSAYRFPYSTPEDFEIIFKNTSGIEYILDTGNFWFCDADFLKVYDKYADITKHVHLKDISPNENGFLNANGKGADSNDIGSGIINFPELFKRLKAYQYNGCVSIEICNSDNLLSKLIKSLNYINSLK